MDLPASPHGELLRTLMPPVSYDAGAPGVARSLTVDGLTLDRAHAHAEKVLLGLTPFKDLDWLETYEKAYNLPWDCFSGPLTLDERITQLAVALKERGGISREFYSWLASIFDYALEIQEFRPFVAGSKAGEILSNGKWIYAWILHTTQTQIRAFRVGRNGAGDALREWGDTRFECLFRKYAPAHTVLHFAYE